MTPNWFAIFALVGWPLVAVCLYLTRPVTQATVWTILGGYLFLPSGATLHIAGIPELDKETSATLGALLGILLVLRRPLRLSNGLGIAEVLLLTLLISPFITEELNTDSIILADRVIPGGSHYDALSAVVRQFLVMIPFFIGRQFLRASSDIQAILRSLLIAGLLYSLPILFEVRMSPVLQTLVYGFFPNSSYVEEIRWGGYRPVVFLGHGLVVSLFVMTTAVAAAAHWRSRNRAAHLSAAGVTGYLSVILVLCKTLGSLIYGAMLIPMVCFTNTKIQARIAVLLATIALCYPLLRMTDLVPTKAIGGWIAGISPDRADSLEFRFDQEKQLLDRTTSRLFFGWGRFGRSLVYNQDGRDISTTDGEWIVTLGTFGLVGFIAQFGLLALPIYRAASALKYAWPAQNKIYLAALVLISAITMFDLLLNSGGLSTWTWLISGSLLGHAEGLRATARERQKLGPLSLARPSVKTIHA